MFLVQFSGQREGLPACKSARDFLGTWPIRKLCGKGHLRCTENTIFYVVFECFHACISGNFDVFLPSVLAMRPLKFGTLSFHLAILVPVLIPSIASIVILRPTTVSRPSNPPNPSTLVPQIRLLWTIVRIYKLYFLLT